MGKPTSQPTPSAGAGDAFFLRTQSDAPPYDQDAPELSISNQNDDLPPLYDEAAEASGSNGLSLSAPLLPSSDFMPGPFGSASDLSPFRRDDTVSHYLDHRLDTDPGFLESHIRQWASAPPRPFVRIYGYHRRRRRNSDANKTTNITDFDVRVELTPYLFADAATRQAWNELHTIENEEKARRGTVLRRRAPGARKIRGNIELGMVEKPSLREWCHIYCASNSGLKAFSLRRCVKGFDHDRVRKQLEDMVRRTNYRGQVQILFPVQDETVEVWCDTRVNQWRLTRWIYLMFCVSMLWLLSWPYLFFRTKRFETVKSEWYFSKLDGEGRKLYVSLSEDQWYNMWGRAISKAVLSKRQDTLDQRDLLADGVEPAFNTGSSSVDGALGFVRAGVDAMNEVNRQLGWGEDSFW